MPRTIVLYGDGGLDERRLSCLVYVQVHIVLYARTADRPPQSSVVRPDHSNPPSGTRYYITVQLRHPRTPVPWWEGAFISPRRVSVLGLDGRVIERAHD